MIEVPQVLPLRNDEVVAQLQRSLERALSGETTGVLVMEQDRKGLNYAVVGIDNRYLAMGVMAAAIHKLQA